MISASAVPRLLACPASESLPHQDYQTTYADQGTDYHAEMEAAADVGDRDALPDGVSRLILDGDVMASECAFAYDVATDTARELGHVSRAYGTLRPFEIPGTVDLIIRGRGRAIVVDYKGHERVAPAATNTQLATYALMVARAYDLDEVDVVICYRTSGWCDSATLDALDLAAHADRLCKLLVAAAAPSAPVPGPHCKYCPAFLSCPEQKALAIRVEETKLVSLDYDDEAAAAYELLGRIKTLVARISAAVYARAAERPIPLPSGKTFGPVTKQGNEKLDGDTVYEIVKARHGQAIADAAVVRAASKARLKEALKPLGKVATLEREILEEVRARGGAERTTKTVVEEF